MTLEYQELMESLKTTDKVNHPSHYTWLKNLCGIEVIDITRHMGFNLGNVIKYILRAGHKSEEGYSDKDKEIEDLKKAKWYLDDEIKMRSREVKSDQPIKLPSVEFCLTRGEILKAAKLISESPLIQNPVTFVQTFGPIGSCTKMTMTVESENDNAKYAQEIDLTDYEAW